jgi:GT2 family glycosyltransferase
VNTTVVIPTHAEANWNSLVRAVASARSQTLAAAGIVVVVDHNLALFRRVRRDIGGITVLENAFAPGTEGSRNTGAFAARTPLVAFLDDDAVAGTDWLARLTVPFADASVVGAGGGIGPTRQRRRPRWMPGTFLRAAGDARADRPGTRPCGMVVRREVFTAVGGFRPAGDTDVRADERGRRRTVGADGRRGRPRRRTAASCGP